MHGSHSLLEELGHCPSSQGKTQVADAALPYVFWGELGHYRTQVPDILSIPV